MNDRATRHAAMTRDATLRSGNDPQSAAMLHEEALQEIVVKPVRILEQVEEMEARLRQLEIQRGISKIGMKIDEQSIAKEGIGKKCAELCGNGSCTTSTFSSHKGQNLASALVLFFLST